MARSSRIALKSMPGSISRPSVSPIVPLSPIPFRGRKRTSLRDGDFANDVRCSWRQDADGPGRDDVHIKAVDSIARRQPHRSRGQHGVDGGRGGAEVVLARFARDPTEKRSKAVVRTNGLASSLQSETTVRVLVADALLRVTVVRVQ